MNKKRVEYQKFLRTKFEQKRYREIFGLTDNIELRSEEGKERMANEVLTRIMMNMPPEKLLVLWDDFAEGGTERMANEV